MLNFARSLANGNPMRQLASLFVGVSVTILLAGALHAASTNFDAVSQQQADLEKSELASGAKHSQIPEIVAFRKNAQRVEYSAGQLKLPGWLYRPPGEGPFPAVIWN